MSIIGEAALSVFLELLFDKMASSAVNYIANYKQVPEQLKSWQKKLPDVLAVLNDAEQKQITDEGVKDWLADLQHLAYDVDDILDEFAYEALRLKLQETGAQASTSKVRKLIPTCCIGNFSPASFMFNHAMISKIEGITDGLNELETRRNSLGLSKIMSKGIKGKKPRLQPGCVLDETVEYVGRETEKRDILELLKCGNGADEGVSVITIVGTGGMGKTTLAQLVYNDATIKESFDHMAWVTVSDDFDAINITRSILECITSKPCELNNLSSLQPKLKDELSGKRFLLVLDDLWNESYNDWTVLRAPFGAGTKIIVTTRLQKVSSNVVTEKANAFHLDKLSHEDCLSIFAQHALRARDFNANPELKDVGVIIVRRCNGLPLAAKAIGGLLRTTRDPNEWEKICKSEIWDLPEHQCDVIPALRLSYHHLPPHLKRCFAYCSILPKDYEFDEEEIILLWRAEGLLQQKSKSQIRDFGNECFQELLSRSFFQVSSQNKSRFVMHDLINDLAQSIAREMCFHLENDKPKKVSNRTRHLSYVMAQYEGVKKFEAFNEVNSLRTFLPMMSQPRRCHLTSFAIDDLLPKFKCLRVLSLKSYTICKLPDFFENFRHLRYLNFSHTFIKCLPDSLCTLYHLETLILKGCWILERLPSDIGNLRELHYLDITPPNSLQGMPFGIGKLTNLERLSNFILGEGDGHRIRELRNLSNLKGDFCLSGLENIIKHQDARDAKLIEKSEIDSLELRWSENFSNDATRKKEAEEQVLDSLHPPHKKLERLIIWNYGGAKFPAWIVDSSFRNLLHLELRNCNYCKTLPSIGKLPKLKYLLISGFGEVDKVGVELFGGNQSNAFASLDTLIFNNMPNWKEWDPCDGDQQVPKFPSLRKLSISECPQLSGRLPTRLPSLQELVIGKCARLVVSVSSFPSLCELKIEGCEELVDKCSAEEEVKYSLQKVRLSDISKLSIPAERIGSRFANLESFEICESEELTSLWEKRFGLVGHRCITIQKCPQLVSLETETEEVEVYQEVLHSSGIQSLKIRECERLNRLPKVFQALKFLTEMEIAGCPGLVCFAENSLPPTLMKLEIWDCQNLQYLVDERESKSIRSSNTICLLEELEIRRCSSLICILSSADTLSHLQRLQISGCSSLNFLFLNAKLPTGLKQFHIKDCPELESIAQDFYKTTALESILLEECNKIKSLPPGLDKLSHLQQIHISGCSNLVFSFEESGWPPATNLRVFGIEGCENFGALPDCFDNFTSLRKLSVLDCGADFSFPEEGFPTNLTELEISNAPKLYRSVVEWGLHKLTSLQRLEISGEGCSDVVSFPEKDMMLPPSLTDIFIWNFENLEYMLSKGFQDLTSLNYFHISHCPKLRALPEKDMLLSLGKLRVYGSPLLEKKLRKKGKGAEWFKIAHIPLVIIDTKIIIPPQHKIQS